MDEGVHEPSKILMFGDKHTEVPVVIAALETRFRYRPWTQEQIAAGKEVTDAAIGFGLTVIKNVPPCPTRTRVINLIEEIRMLSNAAITHEGKF